MQLRSRTGVPTRKERLPCWPVEIYGRSMKRGPRPPVDDIPADSSQISPPIVARLTLFYRAALSLRSPRLFPLLHLTFSQRVLSGFPRHHPSPAARSIHASHRPCARTIRGISTFYVIKRARGNRQFRRYPRLKMRANYREEIDVDGQTAIHEIRRVGSVRVSPSSDIALTSLSRAFRR